MRNERTATYMRMIICFKVRYEFTSNFFGGKFRHIYYDKYKN
ncbi:hypothetical protein RBEAN4_1388 [Rickettsia bellii str. RML An4]|uniref:Uncharacterized protein n=1 Tax=Rickettsia bellii str. RML An4 TaxID=1359193 RepID=A0A0F3QCR3_RICBE|nr:hypothetical protein RBEAN4_1388 [Rickettsia bellii str. RML An4]